MIKFYYYHKINYLCYAIKMVVVESTEIMYNYFDSQSHRLHHSVAENQQFDCDQKSLLHPTAFLTI
jgi:hypothetical protein